MKKLLIIAPQNPFPPKDGGKIGIYYPLIHLAKYFQIHFVFFFYDTYPAETKTHFDQFGIKMYPQKVNTKDSVAGVLLNLFSRRPYKFQKYHRHSTLRAIKEIVRKESIPFIWCNHSHMAWYALQLQQQMDVKIFLREHNIEYSLVQQVMQLKRPGLLKMFIGWQYLKTKRHEIDCWKMFNRTFFISDSDFSNGKKECNTCKNLDLVYDSSYVKKERKVQKREPYSFIFTGNVETFQNSYNLQRFITEIWEPLIKIDNRWKLYITGNKSEILEGKIKTSFQENNVVNLGFVDDIEQAIGEKKYFISPTYIGSGVRIKVLNAMAGGAVCFLTPLDANMLHVFIDFENMIKFNNFNNFHDNLMRIESDYSLYNSISLQALNAGTGFTWINYAIKAHNEITRL